jgi:putative phage-type endonuclease
METLTLVQGTAEWSAHRAQHFNASDAPAMMACSPYKTRTELLHAMHSGISPEVDARTQRRFDDGHRFEKLALPVAEDLIGEDLSPVVGVSGKYSASFDGLTMDGSIAFEHKTLNDQLRAALMSDAEVDALPLHYRVQMEQQLMVSGALKVLFMASKWSGDEMVEEMHCWYESDADLRAEIVAGWAQFAADLDAYVPPERAAAPVVAEAVESLPAPVVQVTGTLTLQDNFKVFEERLRDFLANKLIREPKTDEDFVNLDAQIKAMKQGRDALKSARAQMLAQVQPVDQASKTADMLDKLLQENCSLAERLLKDEKERRRGEIVAGGVSALRTHIEGLNTRLGKPYMPAVPADFGGAVRGLKSLKSMEEKVDGELARAKIEASGIADRIQINLTTLREHAAEVVFLFPDTAQIVLKAPDDLATLVKARIGEHQAKEQARIDADRERIRKEEAARIEREQEAERQCIAREQAAQAAAAAPPPAAAPVPAAPPAAAAPVAAPAPAPTVIAMPPRAQPAANVVPTLSIGAINERLQHFTVTAEGLRGLGFEPAGRERAAPRYHESDFTHILAAMANHLQAIQAKQAA